MWTRNQERLLVMARLQKYEFIFATKSWWDVGDWEEPSWKLFAAVTGLQKTKTPLECCQHFRRLYNNFRSLKLASKLGERKNTISDKYYEEFNNYFHLTNSRSDFPKHF